MDFKTCFEILQNRFHQDSECPTCKHINDLALESNVDELLNGITVNTSAINTFSEKTIIELIGCFQRLQEERVKVFTVTPYI
jgi:phage FluMu protein Com